MTKRDSPFKVGEWYHCYNRSIEGRNAFEDSRDYFRFLELLYLANDESPLRRDDLGPRPFEEILAIPRGKPLVAIGAFCLMPDDFNLVVHEVSEGGITAFMRKLGTAYTLYFNSRYKRVGNLFLKPFRSRQSPADRALQNLVSYVHSHPAVLREREWKTNHVVDPQFLEEHLVAYPYSSLGVQVGTRMVSAPILDAHKFPATPAVPLQKMLQEARRYSVDSGIP
jgi:hypothetical protein